MICDDFSHVDTWVFDLDNTLYPPGARLFDQIEAKMTRFVMETFNVDRHYANHLRYKYWVTYGTTLAGLMSEHGIDPHHYLVDVHDISLNNLEEDPALAARIRALPGRKIVYTNGSGPYAQRVLKARGFSDIFDAVYGVEHADFHPKPTYEAFATIFQTDGINPKRSAMFEDDPRNLRIPYTMGMRTILVADSIPDEREHIHYHTNDLTHFLAQLVR